MQQLLVVSDVGFYGAVLFRCCIFVWFSARVFSSSSDYHDDYPWVVIILITFHSWEYCIFVNFPLHGVFSYSSHHHNDHFYEYSLP